MTEEEIRERDAKCGFGKDHNKVIMGWQAEKDRRWLLRELEQVRKAYENQGLLLAGTAEQLAEVSQQLAAARKDTERLDWSPTEEGWGAYYDDRLGEWNLVSITSPIGRQGVLYALTLRDLIPKCQAADNARGKE